MQRLFLVGLSGSGKTTVGREAARLLGWEYVDTDELLAARSGMAVGQALVEYGEARFRELETEALAKASEQERVVIATGGGAVIAEANRGLMQQRGLLVYLRAPVATAWERVQEQMRSGGAEAARPLLAGGDGLQRLQALFDARRQWYEAAPVQIETGEVLPDYAAKQVVTAAIARGYVTGQRAEISYSHEHPQVIVEWGGLHRLPQALQEAGFRHRVFIVTDSGVGGLFAEPVKALFDGAGMEPHIFTVPEGEASKSFEQLRQILDWLIDLHVERREPVVALGGGVVGDLTGFAASCYLRGVPLVQVPTSLLAQVDSAIGGKTGINHPRGKNLVGAFYQPRLILVDPAVLLTLPERAYREGWGEIVKYGMILDAALFQSLEEHVPALLARDPALLTQIIARCIELKLAVVQSDERDGGLRNILNYGHTFGHALEAITGFSGAETWLHGEAVSLGMEVAAAIAVARGLLAHEDAVRQQALLQALGLPTTCAPVDIDAALATIQRDKKVQDGRTRWVLPSRIGQVAMYNDVGAALVREAIAAVCSGEDAAWQR
ncbi:MAG TPA: 3-dehydroquinate synthase [Chthonomonadales bacterium]|nr:3-dehydroquinate synthase [Chthonomonadales bacterium]